MENKIIFLNNVKAEDYNDNASANIQMFKDSLENSVNMLSLNDSLNTNNNFNQNSTYQQGYTQANFNDMNKFRSICEDDSIDEIEELSTEEKTNFSNNLKNLRKSVAIKTSTNQTQTQSQLLNSLDLSFFKDEETAKISYKFISKSDRELAEQKINNLEVIQSKHKEEVGNLSEEDNNFFWFAAYDKLIKTKNLKKIFDFFVDCSNSSNSNVNNKILREQAIILKDFEIFFDINSHSKGPFIRQKKDSFVFLKLYYLSVRLFNRIYNYINKTEQKFKKEDFLFTNTAGDTFNFKVNLNVTNSISMMNHPYSQLICLGSFLNTNIYTFTNYTYVPKTKLLSTPSPKISLIPYPQPNIKPKIKTIVKLIKYLTETFTSYSEEFFMYHLYSRNGINPIATPNRKDRNGTIQIQLTEIKSLLNKNKLKNLEIKNSSTLNNTVTNNNYNIKSINITTANSNKNNSNSFRSFKVNHSKNISNKFNSVNKNTHANSINSKTSEFNNLSNLKHILLNDSEEMTDICNHRTPKAVEKSDLFTKLNQHSTNTKIFVVSREHNMRLKTELEDEDESDESSFDCELSSDKQLSKNGSVSNRNEECFNTPTRKRVVRYYS